jgi:hypothetical protein
MAAELEPGAIGSVAAAICALLLVAAFAASLGGGQTRLSSLAAAAALLLLVAVGVYLYAWRFGVPGRSDVSAPQGRR